jgi:hypothetical protein
MEVSKRCGVSCLHPNAQISYSKASELLSKNREIGFMICCYDAVNKSPWMFRVLLLQFSTAFQSYASARKCLAQELLQIDVVKTGRSAVAARDA